MGICYFFLSFRLEGFDSNLHIDVEFALRDASCFDSKFLQIVAAQK